MQEEDFPALHRSADQLSLNAQQHFFKVLLCHLAMLFAAAVLSVLNSPAWQAAVAQALVLIGALGCSIYLAWKRPDRTWYSARAVAESVKTLTWRYVSRAEPFDVDDVPVRNAFRSKLAAIVQQNQAVSEALTEHLMEAQITSRMEMLRASPFAERRDLYRESRVGDQLSWYSRKSKQNRLWSQVSFGVLIAVNSIAIVFALAKIKYHDAPIWPTDALVTLAACAITWMQAKRFSELASSYALAAHEINLIREGMDEVIDEQKFSLYVSDAENAFSREHTQWIARKDA